MTDYDPHAYRPQPHEYYVLCWYCPACRTWFEAGVTNEGPGGKWVNYCVNCGAKDIQCWSG